MELENILASFGIEMSKEIAKEIWSKIKNKSTESEIKLEIDEIFRIYGYQISSDKIIQFLGKNNHIDISHSKILAKDELSIECREKTMNIHDDVLIGTPNATMMGSCGSSIRGRGKILFKNNSIIFSV